MDIKEIMPGFSVTSQVLVEDLVEVAALGFKSLVNNRPDDEEEGQPKSAELSAEAERLNLHYLHVPVNGMALPADHDAQAFAEALDSLPKPVLGFCRTGNRAVRMWAIAKAGELDVSELLAAANRTGFCIDDMELRIEELAAVKDTDAR